MLRDFRAGNFGTLPPAVVWIPWIVRSELVGISSRDLSKCFQPNLTTAGQAGAALDYLDAVTLEEGTCVIYQNQMEFAEANQLRTFEDDKDELVLLSCFQVSFLYYPIFFSIFFYRRKRIIPCRYVMVCSDIERLFTWVSMMRFELDRLID